MSSEDPGGPEADAATAARSRNAGRFRTGIRGLIVAVACCGVMAWAGRSLWESQHSALVAARGLRSSVPADRVGAARQLQTLGFADPDRASPPLIAALGDPEVEVRIAAAESLAVMGWHRASLEGLIGALNDREPAVRIAAMNALHSAVFPMAAATAVDLPATLDAIAARVCDEDEWVRLAALYTLTTYGRLASAGPPPAALAAALRDRSTRNQAAAVTALAAFPSSLDPWLASLLAMVEHGDPEVRGACRSAFARDRPPAFSAEAIPALVVALGSRSRIVRSFAARALYPHADDPRAVVAIPALLALLREPIDPELLLAPRPGQAMVFNGWDPSVEAAYLLGRLAPGTRSAGEALAAFIDAVASRRGAPEEMRIAAIEAMPAFGAAATRALARLRELREDPSSRVRAAAEKAVMAIESRSPRD